MGQMNIWTNIHTFYHYSDTKIDDQLFLYCLKGSTISANLRQLVLILRAVSEVVAVNQL